MPIAISAAFMADDAAADDHHLARRDARHAAEQQPAAAERLLEHERAGLRGDLARDLAHRRQQRQPPAAVLDRLVGDAGRADSIRPARQLGVGREVQVGEERVARAAAARPRSGWGSLTLTISSASANTASASGTIARALRRRSRRRRSPSPRPRRPGRAPRGRVGQLAHAGGVSATRYSSVLISVGTPTFMCDLAVWVVGGGADDLAAAQREPELDPVAGAGQVAARSAPRPCGSGSAACGGGSTAAARRPPTARCTR